MDRMSLYRIAVALENIAGSLKMIAERDGA
jgi:hypothetical protein